MRVPAQRLLVGLIVLVLVGVIPMIVLAANGNGPAKPTVTHGPKRTPVPTRTPTSTPTMAPSAAPTVVPTPTATPTLPPTLPPSPPPATVLVGAGDIASCVSSGDEATADRLDTIGGTVFTLGDNVYDNGTATEFTDCYGPSWGRPAIKSRTRPVPGNHEYNTPGATGYYGYFGAAAGDPTKGYYAYDAGTWRVYVLNSNCTIISCSADSAQEQWLRSDLAANPRSCVVAMWHHPRFSSGSEHGSSTATQALWQTLYDFNADLILTGHDHDYERFAPQTAAGVVDNARGIVEFVVGTGGRSHYLFGTIQPNSLVRNSDTYGVLRLALAANSWQFLFIPVAGQTFSDSGSGTCH
jgi:hypothetical protein